MAIPQENPQLDVVLIIPDSIPKPLTMFRLEYQYSRVEGDELPNFEGALTRAVTTTGYTATDAWRNAPPAIRKAHPAPTTPGTKLYVRLVTAIMLGEVSSGAFTT